MQRNETIKSCSHKVDVVNVDARAAITPLSTARLGMKYIPLKPFYTVPKPVYISSGSISIYQYQNGKTDSSSLGP